MPNAIRSAWIVLSVACAQAAHGQQRSGAGEMLGVPSDGQPLLAGQVRPLQPSLAMRVSRPVAVTGAALRELNEREPDFPVRIQFDPGSARLKPSATRALDRLGQALGAGALAGERVRIEGHADAVGPFETNRDISDRRANAVAAYLKDNYGISFARLDCIARGSGAPARRIVLIIRMGNE